MLMYQSADEYVHYTHFETFADFITEKKAGDILAQHQSRGLPETQFTERYKRFAKSKHVYWHAYHKQHRDCA